MTSVVTFLIVQTKRAIAPLVLASVLALGAGLVIAGVTGESPSYAINESVAGGGGNLATAPDVLTNSTVGQAAVAVSSSASYGIESGYWHAGASVPVTLQSFTID